MINMTIEEAHHHFKDATRVFCLLLEQETDIHPNNIHPSTFDDNSDLWALATEDDHSVLLYDATTGKTATIINSNQS